MRMPNCLRHTDTDQRTCRTKRGDEISCKLPCLPLYPRLTFNQQDDVVTVNAVTHEPIEEPLGAFGLKEGVLAWNANPAEHLFWIDLVPTLDRGVAPLHSAYYLLLSFCRRKILIGTMILHRAITFFFCILLEF